MVVILVLITFVALVAFDALVIFPIQERKRLSKEQEKQEIFYSPEVGLTMADGGEPIEKTTLKKD